MRLTSAHLPFRSGQKALVQRALVEQKRWSLENLCFSYNIVLAPAIVIKIFISNLIYFRNDETSLVHIDPWV